MLSRFTAYLRLWVSPARRSLLWITSGVVLSTAASFIAAILTARGMSPEDRGAYLQILAMLAITAMLAQLGLGLPIISLANGSVDVSNALVARSRLFVWPSVLVAALACTYWSVKQVSENTETVWALGLVVFVTTPVMVVGSRMLIRTRVREDYAVLGIGSATPTVLPAVIMAGLYVTATMNPLSALVAFLIGQIAVMALVYGRERFFPQRLDGEGNRGRDSVLAGRKELLRLGMLDLLAFGPSSVTGRLQIIVIGVALSAAAASEYSVAASLSSPLALLSTTLYSYFGSRYASATRADRPRLLRKGLQSTLVAGAGISLVAILAAIALVPILYGDEYASAVAPGAVMAIAGIAGIAGLVASLALRLERRYTVVLVTSYVPLVGMLTLGWLAARHYGLMGFSLVLSAIALVESVVLCLIALRVAGNRQLKPGDGESDIAELTEKDLGTGAV